MQVCLHVQQWAVLAVELEIRLANDQYDNSTEQLFHGEVKWPQSSKAILDLISETTQSNPSMRPAPVTALQPTILQCRVPIACKSRTCTCKTTLCLGLTSKGASCSKNERLRHWQGMPFVLHKSYMTQSWKQCLATPFNSPCSEWSQQWVQHELLLAMQLQKVGQADPHNVLTTPC